MELMQHTLLQAMANPGAISSDELEVLEKAALEHPYFQLAHTLLAKVKHDRQTPDAYESLGHAAIYAPDRKQLRRVFYEDVHILWQPSETHVPEGTGTESSVLEETAPAKTTPDEPEVVDSTEDTMELEERSNAIEPAGVANPDEEEEAVYRELEENLRNLRKAKEESQKEEDEDKKKITAEEETSSATANDASADQDTPPSILPDQLPGTAPLSWEGLGVNQQKQNELIRKFVNSDTNTIGRLRPSVSEDDAQTQDLSQHSSTYTNEIVTENLAEIMLKQGKKEKAIEIYQQLILKNPPKKAYFAEKIEQIKQR